MKLSITILKKYLGRREARPKFSGKFFLNSKEFIKQCHHRQASTLATGFSVTNRSVEPVVVSIRCAVTAYQPTGRVIPGGYAAEQLEIAFGGIVASSDEHHGSPVIADGVSAICWYGDVEQRGSSAKC
jgi:hypothetical protein